MQGFVDHFLAPNLVGGWAENDGTTPATIRLIVNGIIRFETVANLWRSDLNRKAGFVVLCEDGMTPFKLITGGAEIRANDTKLNVFGGYESYLRKPEDDLPEGLTTKDGTFIAGKYGYIFVYGGTNNLKKQFELNSDKANELANMWKSLIETRISNLEDRNIRFMQILIPEKSTVIPNLISEPSGVTPIYAKLSDHITGNDQIINTFPFLTETRELSFKKLDTHFTGFGTLVVFNESMRRLGFPVVQDPEIVKVSQPDLYVGKMFGGFHLIEKGNLINSRMLETLGRTVDRFEHKTTDGSVGTIARFRNGNAPIKKRVMAFGNSFFAAGVDSATLSWWFARMFSEFHFVWSPNIDYDEIQRVKPDIVVAQTIERFLIRVPQS